jgi:myo-inositol-1(or 4)-monophosphatase
MEPFRTETSVAIAGVRRALAIASSGIGEVRFKEGRDVVTDADVAIEDEIRAFLGESFGITVVGEERGGVSEAGAPYWLVDPICGTRNFASGIPLFAVNLALVEGGQIVAAVVGDGASGSIYAAELGEGSWKIGESSRTQVSASPASHTVDVGGWPLAGVERDCAAQFAALLIASDEWDYRSLSTTLALSYVAIGRLAGCVLLSGPAPVHVAAGALLAAESGALVTDLAGGRWSLESTSLLACADAVLQRSMLEAATASGVAT